MPISIPFPFSISTYWSPGPDPKKETVRILINFAVMDFSSLYVVAGLLQSASQRTPLLRWTNKNKLITFLLEKGSEPLSTCFQGPAMWVATEIVKFCVLKSFNPFFIQTAWTSWRHPRTRTISELFPLPLHSLDPSNAHWSTSMLLGGKSGLSSSDATTDVEMGQSRYF